MVHTVCVDHVFRCRKRLAFYLWLFKRSQRCLFMLVYACVCEMFEPESWGGGVGGGFSWVIECLIPSKTSSCRPLPL